MLVVATSEADVAAVQQRLADGGARPIDTCAPGRTRRLVRAEVGSGRSEWQIAARLRAEGLAAVSRPDRGGALAAWERDTAPIEVGDRLTVCAACSEHDRRALPGVVELAPGGFGTGRHPATRLVLEELAARIEGGERVLDVGCGNGVLGLAALRLGAADVAAVDIDPAAVDATRRSAALNGMEQAICAHSSLDAIGGSFDVVVANVGRSVAVELGASLVHRLTPGGWLAVSGISPSQASSVAGFLHPLVERGRRTTADWALLVLGWEGSPYSPPVVSHRFQWSP